MFILSGIQQLAPWFNNDLDNNVVITVLDTGFNNDWISLQWIQHFEKFSARKQQGAWRLLLLDSFGSHHIYEVVKFCEDHKIIPFSMPSHTTHLLQPLDVGVFQPLKHWHLEAVNDAVQNGDETFSKVEFLHVLNTFQGKAFKPTTICSAWEKTGLIPYNPGLVVDKVRQQVPPPRAATPPPQNTWLFLDQTPRTIKDLPESMFNQIASRHLPEELLPTWSKFAKGVVVMAQKEELLETRPNGITAAKNAQKARLKQSNKILQAGSILYSKDAQYMVCERLELEERRDQERKKAREKRFTQALQKCFKQTKKWRTTKIDKKKEIINCWKVIIKKLLRCTPMYVED